MANYLVDDGYTKDFYIAGNELHDPLEMTFRPMTRDERDKFMENLKTHRKGENATTRLATLIGQRVTEWNVQSEPGVYIDPKDKATVVRLRPTLLDAINFALLGLRASDKRPDDLTESTEELTPAETEEADAKNL